MPLHLKIPDPLIIFQLPRLRFLDLLLSMALIYLAPINLCHVDRWAQPILQPLTLKLPMVFPMALLNYFINRPVTKGCCSDHQSTHQSKCRCRYYLPKFMSHFHPLHRPLTKIIMALPHLLQLSLRLHRPFQSYHHYFKFQPPLSA
jgi:hypothetical protein